MTVRYLFGRVAGMLGTLFGVAVVVFLVLRALPGQGSGKVVVCGDDLWFRWAGGCLGVSLSGG